MITSTFNNELSILETEFKGPISRKEIIDYLSSFNKKKCYPKILKTIIDATEASAKFSFADIQAFNKEKNKFVDNYDLLISAVIINNPSTAAIGTLYGAIASNHKYKYKVFSTHEAALFWINSFSILI